VLKRFSRLRWVRWALYWLGGFYIRLVYATSRWTVEGAGPANAFWDRREPFILAFWHSRLMMMPYIWRRGVTIKMLVSNHPDGEFITRTVVPFGIETVRGSTSKGGAQALRLLLGLVKTGTCVGLTPDGPRGPRMRAAEGIVALAKLSGVPVVPAAYSISSARFLNSWDRFLIARPFGRGLYLWGEPILVMRDDDTDAARIRIEQALNALTREADRRCGLTPIEPAELVHTPARHGAGR
jgi:lysophospholipid acyltransferase (LPLAT)-like uncharacterized protein